MQETEQMKGLSIHEHGLSVKSCYQDLMFKLENKLEVIDPILEEIYILVKDKIYSNEIIYRYQEFHDCGKPYCLIIDDEGKKHFPEHEKVSAALWREIFPEEKKIAELIEHDMDFHTLKGDDIDKLWRQEYSPSLYFTAWAEIIANSKMFGGFESTSFKIKKKKLVQAGKKYKNLK